MTSGKWRVGRSLGRTLYRNEVCVGMVDTPETAAEIVARMNQCTPTSHAPVERSPEPSTVTGVWGQDPKPAEAKGAPEHVGAYWDRVREDLWLPRGTEKVSGPGPQDDAVGYTRDDVVERRVAEAHGGFDAASKALGRQPGETVPEAASRVVARVAELTKLLAESYARGNAPAKTYRDRAEAAEARVKELDGQLARLRMTEGMYPKDIDPEEWARFFTALDALLHGKARVGAAAKELETPTAGPTGYERASVRYVESLEARVAELEAERRDAETEFPPRGADP